MRSRHLVHRLASKLGGKSPASPIGRRAARAPLAEQAARAVLELAVRVGEAMLSLGAAATDVTDAIRRVCRAYGIDCQVDLTFTSILVVHDGGEDSSSVSVLRVVDSRTADYDRLARVAGLLEEIEASTASISVQEPDDRAALDSARQHVEEMHARLDTILTAPHRYRRSVVTLLLALMAAGVAMLLGGGPAVVVLAGATTALIDLTVRWLGRLGLPAFFLQAAGAAVASLVAVALLVAVPYLPVEFVTLPPSIVVASGIVVLLAGVSLVGAADDAINGFPITAAGRLLEVTLLTLGIVVGIAGVLDLARRLGVELVLAYSEVVPWPLPFQVLGAAVASGAWAPSSYAGARPSLFVAALGAAAYTTFRLFAEVGFAASVASGAAAVLIGFCAQTVGARLRIPVIVTTVCATVPLLPGLTIYRGMFEITSGPGLGAGAELLLQAGLIGVALAAGVTLGKVLARLVPSVRRPLAVAGGVSVSPTADVSVRSDPDADESEDAPSSPSAVPAETPREA